MDSTAFIRNTLLALSLIGLVLVSTFWMGSDQTPAEENPREWAGNDDQVLAYQTLTELRRAEDWEGVKRQCEELLSWSENDGKVWTLLALSHLKTGDYDKAAQMTQVAVKFPEFRIVNLYNAACALTLLDQTDRAMDMLEAAVQEGFVDADKLEEDQDLLRLHGTAYFQALLRDLRLYSEPSITTVSLAD